MSYELYKKYRKVGRKLNQKLTKEMDSERLNLAIELLKFEREGNKIIMESDEEMAHMNDFIVNEPFHENRSLFSLNLIKPKGEIEKELLEAMSNAYSSLFAIDEVIPENSELILRDLLNDNNKIRLIDMGFSMSAFMNPDILIFTRIIPLPDFFMTSGASFVFDENDESFLLRQYKKMKKKPLHSNESVSRFIHFFLLNRNQGMPVFYQ